MTDRMDQLRADLEAASAAGDAEEVEAIVGRILATMTPEQRRAADARLELAQRRARPC